ncbi:hypothetical protein EVAR_43375_1 [Eumeta japonica]|uniref:C-type lectin domain-containing protein n=1 Tax=Eumeta variegata TaxID=151549 RepID=A0A4C1WS01_EUMVA|nr:hypothetical protein EVAR_43375_1 [Eumeta japonica]
MMQLRSKSPQPKLEMKVILCSAYLELSYYIFFRDNQLEEREEHLSRKWASRVAAPPALLLSFLRAAAPSTRKDASSALRNHAWPGGTVDAVYWVGASDAAHEGEFRWVDGRPFAYARERPRITLT